MARTKAWIPRTDADPSVVRAWVDELHTLAEQVDALSQRATAELGEDGERLGRIDPLSVTYAFARGAHQWADRLQEHFLD